MRTFLVSVALISVIGAVVLGQKGTAEPDYYPQNYSGDTWTGVVTAVNEDSREFTLTYKKKDKEESFVGVLPKGYVVCRSDAQTQSRKASDQILRDRIATIFQETLKRGETRIELKDHSMVTAKTFIPPTTEDVEEIQRYGEDAVPILSDYLNRGAGFEKYLAMRFLGSIGGKSIIEPLCKVALEDPSPSFRETALLWLSAARWDLAAPIIRRAAQKDSSPEVRRQAQAILRGH